jgi:hypothetical protein
MAAVISKNSSSCQPSSSPDPDQKEHKSNGYFRKNRLQPTIALDSTRNQVRRAIEVEGKMVIEEYNNEKNGQKRLLALFVVVGVKEIMGKED